MSYTQLTAVVILATVFLLTVYDIVIAYLSGGSATISWCVYQWSTKYPFIAFAFGFLMGHLFSQMLKSSD